MRVNTALLASGICEYVTADDRTVIYGTNSDDVIDEYSNVAHYSTPSDDSFVMVAGAGADTITGGTDTDQIFGGSGDDTIHVTTGNDDIDGGGGTDTADASDMTNRLNVMLGTGGETSYVSADLLTLGTLTDVEKVIATDYDDVFTVNEMPTTNVELDAGDEESVDILTFRDAAAAVKVVSDVDGSVKFGAASNPSPGNTGSGFEVLVGTTGNDSLDLSNQSGDMTIVGGEGQDTISGGSGNDTIAGDFHEMDSDQLAAIASGFTARDTLAGGTGDDTYSMSGGHLSSGIGYKDGDDNGVIWVDADFTLADPVWSTVDVITDSQGTNHIKGGYYSDYLFPGDDPENLVVISNAFETTGKTLNSLGSSGNMIITETIGPGYYSGTSVRFDLISGVFGAVLDSGHWYNSASELVRYGIGLYAAMSDDDLYLWVNVSFGDEYEYTSHYNDPVAIIKDYDGGFDFSLV